MGIAFCIISLLIGEVVGGLFHFETGIFLQPITLFGGITTFGGVGFLLLKWTHLSFDAALIYAILSAVVSILLLYFLIVRPSKYTENSTGFQLKDLIGKEGEVWTSIPSDGLGEVLITMAGGNSNQIAASHMGTPIAEGMRVVVCDVRDQILYVQQVKG